MLLKLGREDQLDRDGLRRLAASSTRYTDGSLGGVTWNSVVRVLLPLEWS